MPQIDGKAAATTTDRVSDTELVVTRVIKAPRRLVYGAWAEPGLFCQWWTPASLRVTIVSHESDVRTGGSYRLLMNHASPGEPMAVYGKYREVVPDTRIVCTNDETDAGAVSTVTFEDHDGGTLVVVHERFLSKDALHAEIASGATSAWTEQYAQLDELMRQSATPI